MGVLTNGYRDKIGVFRTYGGSFHNNSFPQGTLGNYNLTGMKRNLTAGEGITSGLVGIPMGYVMRGWQMPQKAGAISSRSSVLSFDSTGAMLMGYPIEGSTSITVSIADADGQLISSGNGTASLTFSTNNPLLTASLNAIGEASFTLVTNTPILGAEASGDGSASILINCTATILPVDDTSPLRDGTASFTITGTLLPYATGSMIGSTVDSSVLTVDAIAAGVLAAALTTPIAADIRRVNTYTVTGDGQSGTEWGP